MAFKSPSELRNEIWVSQDALKIVQSGREAIRKILTKKDDRLLIITGPCSIHDTKAALEYARKVKRLREVVGSEIELVMRVYFEKPRTVMGWKGLIYDPYLNDGCRMEKGLEMARELLLKINEMGVPVATEALNPLVIPYLEDLVSWVVIGARTTESQTHREMASSLQTPVAFKNGTDGRIDNAVNSIRAIREKQSYLGTNLDGQIERIFSKGNPWGHLVLRGGKTVNYLKESIFRVQKFLRDTGLNDTVIVDCSHDNSGQQYTGQSFVFRNCLDQRVEGNHGIVGLMLESNLFEGKQAILEDGDLGKLKYGVSVTDGCIGWEDTENLIKWAYNLLSDNRLASKSKAVA